MGMGVVSGAGVVLGVSGMGAVSSLCATLQVSYADNTHSVIAASCLGSILVLSCHVGVVADTPF
jgi:hypothetical protein